MTDKPFIKEDSVINDKVQITSSFRSEPFQGEDKTGNNAHVAKPAHAEPFLKEGVYQEGGRLLQRSHLTIHPANFDKPILDMISYPEQKIMFKGEEISSEQFVAMLMISQAPNEEKTKEIKFIVGEYQQEGIEGLLSAGFWGSTAARLKQSGDKLQEENKLLLKAVKEMKRMESILKSLERNYRDVWVDLTWGTGIATPNAYQSTLEKVEHLLNK